MKTYIAAAALLLCACPPSPSPPPAPPDASDASSPTASCADACTHMAALCGPQAPDCASVMQRAENDRLVKGADGFAMTCKCVAAAGDKATVRACGAACP